MNDLTYLETISIEVGSMCNLSSKHIVCPAHHMSRTDDGILTVDEIIRVMDEAVELHFSGFFAFHFYNEPLLYMDKIDNIKKRRPSYKYLLWSNGTLVEKVIQEGYSLSIFDKMIFTVYSETDKSTLEKLKRSNLKVGIFEANMDERLSYYDSTIENVFACKKPFCELPIDCYGNVYICTYDWMNKYGLGNVREMKLIDILKSEDYQKLLSCNRKCFVHGDVHDFCKHCPRPYQNIDNMTEGVK